MMAGPADIDLFHFILEPCQGFSTPRFLDTRHVLLKRRQRTAQVNSMMVNAGGENASFCYWTFGPIELRIDMCVQALSSKHQNIDMIKVCRNKQTVSR
ncbi:hypothetical protein NPIL_167561 [Nephila pilipes]|uniref:Uncharacterized protein n=1 Tax=Nephila pilipes TaxID=299642 RepID=A0A8X6MCN7_NEPPI|nr:hypothetical protein NPIL_167561 [Nephila pilipes]